MFIRPELAERITRWREPLVWGLILAAGIWLAATGLRAPLRLALGLAICGVAVTFLAGAVRRVRLADPTLGVGVVQIDEGRITYLGPMGGAVIDVNGLEAVEIVGRFWRLTSGAGGQIYIPRGAAGAGRLPDALSQLPGFDLVKGAAPVGRAGRASLIWSRHPETAARRPGPAPGRNLADRRPN